MIYENHKKMCKQHQLDMKLYLPKLQRDYGIAIVFPNGGVKFPIDSDSKLISLKQNKFSTMMFMDSQAQKPKHMPLVVL